MERSPSPSTRVWQAPLLPIAAAATAGVLVDRAATVPLELSLGLLALGVVFWLLHRNNAKLTGSNCWLWVSFIAAGAAYHHWYCQTRSPDDIAGLAGRAGNLVCLRGILQEAPVFSPATEDPLRTQPVADHAYIRMRAIALKEGHRWRFVSGNVRLEVNESLDGLRIGDEVEVVGRLTAPATPGNPGEFDPKYRFQQNRFSAYLKVQHTKKVIKLLQRGARWTPAALLERTRRAAARQIEQLLPPQCRTLGKALLLGQQTALDQTEWDRFQRTGVVHVLAISGQHLMTLALFLGILLRVIHVPQRRGAIIIVTLLFIYALVTGWRPPVRRALILTACYYGGFWGRRVNLPANALALAWLVIGLANPASLFSAGCQLSFLAVAVLLWGTEYFPRAPVDSLERVVEEQKPLWARVTRGALAYIGLMYGASLLIWLSLTPLVAHHFHLISPAGVILGPIALLLTSLALLTGLLMFLSALILPPLAGVFAWITSASLSLCDSLTRSIVEWPGAYWYVPDLPSWWVIGFYLILLGALFVDVQRRLRTGIVAALLLWLSIGLSLPLLHRNSESLRCTFVSVGHGCCVVMQTPEGRTLVYDAGALSGPEVTRRHIAPFLWRRQITRIDEIYLSHADLDHFNGLPGLMERFSIGRICFPATFAQRKLDGVSVTLREIQRRKIPTEVIKAGDVFNAGAVRMQVLHPPETSLSGKENVRSLVMLVTHESHSLLLTGDLESTGLERFLDLLPPVRADILMAPHHGSPTANTKTLAEKVGPQLVVSSQGRPRQLLDRPNPYVERGAKYLTTWDEGAVMIESSKLGLTVETFRSKQRWQLR